MSATYGGSASPAAVAAVGMKWVRSGTSSTSATRTAHTSILGIPHPHMNPDEQTPWKMMIDVALLALGTVAAAVEGGARTYPGTPRWWDASVPPWKVTAAAAQQD